MSDWQPIETAPKDRPILAWCDHEADPYPPPAAPAIDAAHDIKPKEQSND